MTNNEDEFTSKRRQQAALADEAEDHARLVHSQRTLWAIGVLVTLVAVPPLVVSIYVVAINLLL
jgi:hypothetical protein